MPLLAIAGGHIGGAGVWAQLVVSAGLLAGSAAALLVAAVRQLRSIPLEELRRREATSTSLLASAVYASDLRGGSQARRQAVAGLVGRRAVSRRAPAQPWLWAPWSSALLLLRSRERLAHAVVWVGAATVVALTLRGSAWQTAAIPLAAAVAYLAASALVEPLRIELEERFATRSSPWRLARILRRQALVPVAALALIGLAPVVAATAAGALAADGALLLGVAAVAAALLLTACAAVVATGPPPNPDWLYVGDIGISLLVAHLTQGAHLAVAVVGFPGTAALGALAAGVPVALVAGVGLLWAAAATAALHAWARRRLARFH